MVNEQQFPGGARFRARRQALGLSQEKLAHLAGVGQGSVVRVERNDPIVSDGMLARLHRVLELLEADDAGRLQAHGEVTA